jgi:protein-tyrosine phosphatase
VGSTLEPSRHLRLQGGYNFRDVGGYPTSDGRRTRWQLLLRSESLAGLTRRSREALVEYGLRTVVDLRGAVELQENAFDPSAWPPLGYMHQNMMGDEMMAELARSPAPGRGSQRLTNLYTSILDRRRTQVQRTLAALATTGTLPALVHCTAGKDRTGLIVALALSIAGVPRDTIVEDYSLSAQFMIDDDLKAQANPDKIPPGYETWEEYRREFCPPEAMLDTLRHLDERYGGVEEYVLGPGLTRGQLESLRDSMVE